MLKAVLFDLDGTLLDRDTSVKLFIEDQYLRLEKALNHIPKDRYIQRFLQLDNHGYLWKDKVYSQMVEEYNITEISWQALLQDYKSEFKHYCVPFPGLLELLAELRKKQLALGMITNGYEQFQLENIKSLGIESYFDVILISESEGIKKPDPQIFRRALKKINLAPEESIFVGDHLDNDVKAAESLGMIGVWKKNNNKDNIEIEYKIEALSDLIRIVEKLN